MLVNIDPRIPKDIMSKANRDFLDAYEELKREGFITSGIEEMMKVKNVRVFIKTLKSWRDIGNLSAKK